MGSVIRMKIQKIRDYKTPSYPPKELFINKPALLSEYAPLSWKTKAAVAGALMAFVMGGCGGNNLPVKDGKAGQVQVGTGREITSTPSPIKVLLADKVRLVETDKHEQTKEKKKVEEKTTGKSAVIAPIFAYGTGSGATGCIIMSPPSYMSEVDARRIIEDEFLKKGIRFKNHDMEFPKIPIPKIDLSIDLTPIPGKNGESWNLELDGYNFDEKFGYQFVSVYDYFALSLGPKAGSILRFHPKITAEHIRKSLLEQNEISAVIFYDPVFPDSYGPELGMEMNSHRYKEPDQPERLLRFQVQDFLEWAKYQGLLDKLKKAKK